MKFPFWDFILTTVPVFQDNHLVPKITKCEDLLYLPNRFTYPTVTSKMLEPTEEETAISPKPLRATMTLVMRSGMDVPAAKKVRPIT